MNLAEELLLCAIDETGSIASSHKIAAAIGGALVAELTLADRLRLESGQVVPADATPTGDLLADELLAALQAPDATKLSAAAMIPTFGVSAFPRVQEALVTRGAIEMQQGKRSFIGVRKPETRTVTPVGEEPRRRARSALLGEARPDDRTAALAALAVASGYHKVLVSKGDRKAAEQRGRTFAAGDGVAPAVAQAIANAKTTVNQLAH